MDKRNFVPAVVSGGDHDSLMAALSPYETVAFYGNMDPEVKEWLVVTALLPRKSCEILGKSLREDYGLTVTLCKSESEAEQVVKAHPAWD